MHKKTNEVSETVTRQQAKPGTRLQKIKDVRNLG